MSDSYDLPSSFGARSAATRIATRPDLQQLHSMKEKKNEHAKRMEVHNSWRFKLMEICAENMISYENFGKSVLEVVSGNYFHKRWMELKRYLEESEEEELDNVHEESNIIKVSKEDYIQQQILELKQKMDLIQAQLAQKEKEEKLRQALHQSGIQSPADLPPNYRRTSLAPAMLDEADDDDLLPRKEKYSGILE
ncbi:hypothetical protein WA577_006216, partial [Blastocystis sp. JDR]